MHNHSTEACELRLSARGETVLGSRIEKRESLHDLLQTLEMSHEKEGSRMLRSTSCIHLCFGAGA
ncbi:hypothetical protein SMG44B_70139 [Stenotrophomonas maltophilia]